MKKILFICLACTFFFSVACTSSKSEDMYALSVQLNKLTTVAEGYAFFENPPVTLTQKEFLQQAVADDPNLLQPFDSYAIILERQEVLPNQESHVSIMLCSKDMVQGLLQDVGCTPAFDKHLWKENPILPCEPLPDTFAICQ